MKADVYASTTVKSGKASVISRTIGTRLFSRASDALTPKLVTTIAGRITPAPS